VPTRTIGEFVAGKIRRAEIGDLLRFEPAAEPPSDGPVEPLDPLGPLGPVGPLEGRLVSAAGSLAFHRDGLLLEGGAALPYAAIAEVRRPSPELLDIELSGGGLHRLRTTPAGGEVVYAALRWYGQAILRRRIC
jgi:hypothetical protein